MHYTARVYEQAMKLKKTMLKLEEELFDAIAEEEIKEHHMDEVEVFISAYEQFKSDREYVLNSAIRELDILNDEVDDIEFLYERYKNLKEHGAFYIGEEASHYYGDWDFDLD